MLLVLAAATAACGGSAGPPTVASHTPSPAQNSPAASAAAAAPTPSSPPAVTSAYGVLVGSQSGSSFTVSLIGTDGKVVASSEASTPPLVTCANAAGAPLPLPISTSNSRAYFMDAQGVVRFLAPSGNSGRATALPAGTSSRRAMFAVSPDDSRIAVIVNDYTASGAATRLYVEDLNGGGNHLDLFSESGARTLWPFGWTKRRSWRAVIRSISRALATSLMGVSCRWPRRAIAAAASQEGSERPRAYGL